MCSSSAVAKSTVSIDDYIFKYYSHSITIRYHLSKAIHEQAVFRATFFHSFAPTLVSHTLYQADFFGAHTLTFVQKRPIGLGIKNNLGSLYRHFAFFCCLFLERDTLYTHVRRLFNELFAKFY